MRREVVQPLALYGELHRYIPVLAEWAGFKVGEVDVEHAPRLHGSSKFGRARFWRGFFDLLTVKFLTTYTSAPVPPLRRPRRRARADRRRAARLDVRRQDHGRRRSASGRRSSAGVLFVLVGVQLMSLGLIAELVVHLRRDREADVVVDPERSRDP